MFLESSKLSTPLLYSTFGLYLLAGIFYLLQLVFSRRFLARIGARLALVSWLAQTVMLVLYFIKVGYPFLVDTPTSYLFSSWVVALVFLLFNLRYRFQVVGAFVLPLMMTFYLLAFFSAKTYGVAHHWTTIPWASIHITFGFLSFALFSLTFVLAIIFMIEDFQLKHKKSSRLFFRFPSLESLEQVHAKALTIGFILLTGGIITGAAWAKSVKNIYFFEDARQLWTIIAWLIYAFFLHARFAIGWRGRRGVLLSILGFIVILFTFLGVEHH